MVEREWGRSLIRSWNEHDWIGAPQRIGARIAPLIGAKPHEVIVADSVSVNLFKLITAAVALSPTTWIVPAVSVLTLIFLAALGALGAGAGGAAMLRPVMRVVFWGAVALAVTAGIGRVFGVVA